MGEAKRRGLAQDRAAQAVMRVQVLADKAVVAEFGMPTESPNFIPCKVVSHGEERIVVAKKMFDKDRGGELIGSILVKAKDKDWFIKNARRLHNAIVDEMIRC